MKICQSSSVLTPDARVTSHPLFPITSSHSHSRLYLEASRIALHVRHIYVCHVRGLTTRHALLSNGVVISSSAGVPQFCSVSRCSLYLVGDLHRHCEQDKISRISLCQRLSSRVSVSRHFASLAAQDSTHIFPAFAITVLLTHINSALLITGVVSA